MKSNKQKKIKVPQSGNKRARFNWAHDVNTTFNWGELQPTQVKMIQPGSKTTMKAQSLIRLAPMVAPTFGRVKYKTYNQFVEVEEIFPNLASMMAQEPVNRNGRIKVAQKIPSILLGQLSAWCLFGARATLYWVDEGTHGTNALREVAAMEGRYVTAFRKTPASWSSTNAQAMATLLTNIGPAFEGVSKASVLSNIPGAPSITTDSSHVLMMNPAYLLSDSVGGVYPSAVKTDYTIPLGVYGTSATAVLRNLLPVAPGYESAFDPNNHYDCYITMDGADYVLEFHLDETDSGGNLVEHFYAIAFEFSDFGKRIRKILQGCGYQIDLTSTEKVSILPLLAQYKAYFDIFGLTLYQGWETTYASKLIDFIKNNFNEVLDASNTDGLLSSAETIFGLPPRHNTTLTAVKSSFCSFMLAELANEWYTDDPDWISAHMSKLAVSPNVDTSGFITVDQNGVVTPGLDNNVTTQSGTMIDYGAIDTHDSNTTINNLYTAGNENTVHSFIDRVQHGEIDAELLKRIYKWTNRNTILGREIAKILRAQGLGKYVDECKSNFIGSTSNMITISDVVSMADTDISGNGTGAVLGEFGGKGLQYVEDKVLVFENDSLGYWVTLATIVPEAGYTQGLDSTLKALDKFNLYNPDFDAVGMEITGKDAVVGNTYIAKSINPNHENQFQVGFGFIPRYSKFKVAQNLVNGDFNRHNMRNTYLPYTLDKQISVGDYSTDKQNVVTLSNGDVIGVVDINKTISKEYMPVAGNIYREPTKYAWMGNFNRIFMNLGKRSTDNYGTETSTGREYLENAAIGFNDYNSDNFLSHEILDIQCYAPMKPIEESYGLEDDEPGVRGVEYDVKA